MKYRSSRSVDCLEADARPDRLLQRVPAIARNEVVELAAGQRHRRDLGKIRLESPQGLKALRRRAEAKLADRARLRQREPVVRRAAAAGEELDGEDLAVLALRDAHHRDEPVRKALAR